MAHLIDNIYPIAKYRFYRPLRDRFDYLCLSQRIARLRKRSQGFNTSPETPGGPLLICFRPRLMDEMGHYLNNSMGLRRALLSHTRRPIFLTHKHAVAAINQELGGRAVLPHPKHREGWPAEWKTLLWESQLHQHVTPLLSADSWIYFPEARFQIACAAIDYIRYLPKSLTPTIILDFLSDDLNRFISEPRYRDVKSLLARKIWQADRSLRKSIILCSEVAFWAKTLSTEMAMKVLTVPVSKFYDDFDENKDRRNDSDQGVIRVGLPGKLREEKGARLVLELLKRFESHERVQFCIQTELDVRNSICALLNGHPNVRLFDSRLSRTSYVRLLRGMDIIMLPYVPQKYATRSSGVFCEAAAAGIPTIVPGGTWMGTHVDAGRAAGIVFAPYTKAGLLSAFRKCLKNIETLKVEADRLAPCWRKNWSARRFLDIIGHEVASRQATVS